MQKKSLSVILALTVGVWLMSGELSSRAAETSNTCVPYERLRNIHMVDDWSAIATTQADDYKVIFRYRCQTKAFGAYFVLQRERLGYCLDSGDVLQTSGPTPACIVDTVTKMQDVPASGSQE